MTESEAFDRISDVVKATFPAATRVDPATTSADVEGWDSLSYSILIMNVEEAFGIELPVDRIYELDDLGALSRLVVEQLDAQS